MPQNSPKSILDSKIFLGGHAPDPPNIRHFAVVRSAHHFLQTTLHGNPLFKILRYMYIALTAGSI